ncbi:MAG: DnaA regulatory inactivator Hda [Steroidobacteraceae bacterium]
MRQLPLGMRLQDRAVFASFLAGGNALAVAAAEQLVAARGDSLLYLHGSAGTGKSHLLQAICTAVPAAAYFPLAQLLEFGPGVLEAAAQLPAIAVDDLDAVAGDPHWEQQLFGLYNDCLASGTRLAVSALVPAAYLGVSLPDLRSRLSAMPQFALRPLDEAQQREALKLRAAQRGIELPEETLLYLQRRFARDIGKLHALLDRLDLASLQEQRRLTVPFIRAVLGEPP